MCALCYKHREVTPPAFKSDLSSLRDRLKNRDDMILLDCETLHHPGPLTDKSPQTLIQFALLYKAERLEVIIDHGNGLGQVERLNLLRAMVRPPRQEMGWNHVEMNLKTLCNVLDVKLREFPSKSDVEAFEAALKELDSRLAEKGRSPTDAIDELELWMNIPIENGHNTICYWAATHFDQISLDNWYQSVTDEPVSRWHYDKSILPNVQRSIEKKGENRGSAALHSLYISLVDPTRKIPVSMRWHTALADCLIMKAVLNELWKICGDTQPGQRNMSQTKLKQWWKLT
ncbi:uncharacterized protein EV422DRAFT_571076 [Fimicolochytrium jonesii]|uniref:uncharacterized protein n=1 Tax=Fimicolochytrium jonesii TaxID=1396493 RepID=UPI0022FE2847|nr:uncharacterized protein EV422DRAFT_571076 [Fimicolochytrium jonesii]KAI8817215.1 hypothetical protein EV422DRAFT_571076 [Fimicolochytrium jonesii]